MTKSRVIKIIYLIYLIAFVLFIFSNSMTPKNESAQQSGRVLEGVNSILEALKLPILKSDLIIRKLGHFAEFFILGASVFGFFVINGHYKSKHATYASFICCLIAMSDETIQYFSNRGSMLLDVWLDFFSALTAIAVFCYSYNMILIKKQNNKDV